MTMGSPNTRHIACVSCNEPIVVKRDPVLLRELPTSDVCTECVTEKEKGWRDFIDSGKGAHGNDS